MVGNVTPSMLCARAPTLGWTTRRATPVLIIRASSSSAAAAPEMRKIPNSKLFVSEPPPQWFGNESNPPKGSAPGWTNENWLKSRFHFSFAEYNTHKNADYGVLRVMNDDLVQPGRGFGTHGHANMEIVTYIVEGSLTHKDSMGTSESLGRGSIQFMTAGTGVRHSEHNLDKSNPLRFIQMWITPNAGGLAPNYGSHETSPDERKNRWCRLVGPVPGAGANAGTAPVQINQDAGISVAEIDAGQTLPLSVPTGRQAYLLCVEGSATDGAGGESLERHDAAELKAGTELSLTAGSEGAHLLVVEMAERAGSGRKDL